MTALVYHATLTENIISIKKNGLKPFQPTLWAKPNGERYGEGQIFVYEKFEDAVYWASKLAVEQLNHDDDPECISILKIRSDNKWDLDESVDEISRISTTGEWLQRYDPVPASDIIEIVPLTREMIQTWIKRRDAGLLGSEITPEEDVIADDLADEPEEQRDHMFIPETLRTIAHEIRDMRMRMLTEVDDSGADPEAERYYLLAIASLDQAHHQMMLASFK